jgi:hypothetical protein
MNDITKATKPKITVSAVLSFKKNGDDVIAQKWMTS